MSSQSKWVSSSSGNSDLVISEDGFCNGGDEAGTFVALRCPGDGGDATAGMSEFSSSDLSLPEVCISTNSNSFEDDMNYEVQQAYRIFTGFLLDKHKAVTSPFLHPVGHHDTQHGIEGVQGRVQSQLRQSMCLRRIEEKFINQEYNTITEYVADFRLMLENCYRYHGVDHWISKQAQKLEIMLEQKLTLLSRTLREKTTLAVTSKGRFGAEEERSSGGTSTRRRLAPRSLATITVGGHESVMVQALRLEEQQRAKEEKRQRELEKKEAEEMSAKEVEEWEKSLLSQATPQAVDTLWELPAIGHFLCLAQTALNLPEIVFFELERCLLMPRCSLLLSKIMSSLLSPPQRRATLHRRPTLPYRRWESDLRQRVMGWYRAVGNSHNQRHRAEQLGLSHQFFSILGGVNPLEEKPFHLLHFYQRVWLLKGLCDHVYETQKDVQDAVLAQPIHECRESILGYDSKENAYIHFPHFCGADLRIYCQSPSTPPDFPFPSTLVKRVELEAGTEGEDSDGIKNEGDKNNSACDGTPMDIEGSGDVGKRTIDTIGIFEKENGSREGDFNSWSLMEEMSDSGSCDGDDCEDSTSDLKIQTNPLCMRHCSDVGWSDVKMLFKEEIADAQQKSRQEQGLSPCSERTIKAETQDPCLNVGEHSYTGRSPARSVNLGSPAKPLELTKKEVNLSGEQTTSPCSDCCKGKISNAKSAEHFCCCGSSERTSQLPSESTQNSSKDRVDDKMWSKKKKRQKKQMREQLLRGKRERKHLQHVDGIELSPADAAKPANCKDATTTKRKEKKKRHKTGKNTETSKKIQDEPPSEPSFKLVCTSLDELRELISKTEDELDDLESTKKRLGRWYYRREAVKDLHSTLIRLLNELSPWEPKLVKAFQRNRLRLKKEFDDFKKHPEYNNFVREECASSSSDDEYDEEEGDLEKDHGGESEGEDLEHMVPRGLWSGASTREFGTEDAEKMVTCTSPNHLKPHLGSSEKSVGLQPRDQGIGSNIISADSREVLRSELTTTKQSRGFAWTAGIPAHSTVSCSSPTLPPTSGLPKGYTPIPTLLAKSVGNKVTLMKRPTDYPGVAGVEGQRKGSLVSLPTSAAINTKLSKAQTSPSGSQQNLQKMTLPGPQQMQVFGQPGIVTAAPPHTLQSKPSGAESKGPVQVMYKLPEGLGHQVKKDNSSPAKAPVHSAVEQNPAEKLMQQVVILPSNLLIKNTEAKASSSNTQQSKGIQVAVSKVASPVCISTNVPGFRIPENKIPVQQVAPLKDARTGKTPPVSVSSHLQQGIANTAGFKSQVSCVQASTIQCGMLTPSPTANMSSSASAATAKSSAPKQELKTVCIRDSQSILVTTRGGNTGIVKVQTSSDQNALGAFPNTPVITISPQFKAFLVSKSSATHSSSASQTSSSTLQAVTSKSVVQPQKQVPSVLTVPCSLTDSTLTGVTSSIPVTSPGSQNTGTTTLLSQGCSISVGSTVDTQISQLPVTASSPFPASRLNDTAVVSSGSCSVAPQVFKQEFTSKPGVKRAATDEGYQVNKYILVAPPSSPNSCVAASKGTPSPTVQVASPRIMFISQPTVTSPTTLMGSIPKQVMASGKNDQTLSMSLLSQTLKMGLSPVQPVASVSSEASSVTKNHSLPTGVQNQLAGKLAAIGQNIGVLSESPSKAAPLSVSETCGPTAGIISGLRPATSLMTAAGFSPQLGTSLTTSSPLIGIPSVSGNSQTICSTSSSTTANIPSANTYKNYVGTLGSTLFNSFPAPVTTTIGSSPGQTPIPTIDSRPSYNQSGVREENRLLSSPLAQNKNQIPLSSAQPPSSTSTVQQRIIINTSTPLAAGTQILLNNTRFVVPPQGLGPGSHVLLISNPAPQVPAASPNSTVAPVLPKGTSHASAPPRAPVLPQSAARLPGVPPVSSPFVACTPTIGPPLLATTPHVPPIRLTGTPGLGSTLIPGKTNVVSAISGFPPMHAGSFALPAVGSSTLVSSPSRLGSAPALVSPVITSAPSLSSALSAAGTGKQAECLSQSSAVEASSPKSSELALSSRVIPSPAMGAFRSPVIPVPVPHSTAAASVVADAPVFSPLPLQQAVAGTTICPNVVHPQQATFRVAVPSSGHPQGFVHKGAVNTQVPVTQPVLTGTRTQVLPTVAVPPIVSTFSRTQALPIATVPPIGSTVSTFETALMAVAPSSSTSVIISPAQAGASQNSKIPVHSPVVLTNQPIGKHSGQTSALNMHTNTSPKLLISPDGAVLSTVRCQVNPAQLTACPNPLDALVTSSNSSAGALQPHDSAVQPPRADTKRTN
ncbi:putative bromodomain-containing protein 10 [Menidia menidia]